MSVVTRFAPSPTGFLHIGGARTALFAYLFAKHRQGKFILRIEDTDRERSTQEAIDAIIEGMNWLELNADQGPYYQTQHMDRYREIIDQLLASGHAYRCTCTQERLTNLREQQREAKVKPRYDGVCRVAEHSQDVSEPYVIRFKNPKEGEVSFFDHVRGQVTVANSELDDLIIARSDGTPTYNMTVVVDDWDMGVTHVIRGDDHINNTPRQINILQALGAPIPHYAHLPMINGPDGKKLSKRHGAVSVMQYRDDGYLKEALLNYLVRLGWSHGDQEVFSMHEMTELFDLNNISKSSASFNLEKLQWLNQHYMKSLPARRVVPELKHQFDLAGINTESGPDLADLLCIQAEKCKTLKEIVEKSRYFYEPITEYDQDAIVKHFHDQSKAVLKNMAEGLSALDSWDQEGISSVVKSTALSLDLKMPKIAQPIRIAVTGSTMSPSIDVTLQLLGREQTLARLNAALTTLG